jgi:hypothetical protein
MAPGTPLFDGSRGPATGTSDPVLRLPRNENEGGGLTRQGPAESTACASGGTDLRRNACEERSLQASGTHNPVA